VRRSCSASESLNLGLGVSVGVGVGLLGLANSIMWGVAAFILNHIPFIGAVCGTILIAIASLIQFENIWYACLAPILYLVLNAAGEQLRYATVLGKVDDLESRSHFLIIYLLGMALGCGRYTFSRAYPGDSQDIL
jgi:predicted PurR-regulated permease PerM